MKLLHWIGAVCIAAIAVLAAAFGFRRVSRDATIDLARRDAELARRRTRVDAIADRAEINMEIDDAATDRPLADTLRDTPDPVE